MSHRGTRRTVTRGARVGERRRSRGSCGHGHLYADFTIKEMWNERTLYVRQCRRCGKTIETWQRPADWPEASEMEVQA